VPALVLARDLRIVAGLRRGHDARRDEDVILQQRRELAPRGRAVIRGDRIADVGLILQQPLRRRVLILRAGSRVDDEEPRIRDVIAPQPAHRILEVSLRRCERRVRSEEQDESDDCESDFVQHGLPLLRFASRAKSERDWQAEDWEREGDLGALTARTVFWPYHDAVLAALSQALTTVMIAAVVAGMQVRTQSCAKEPYCQTTLSVSTSALARRITFADVGDGPHSRLDTLQISLDGHSDAILAVGSQPGGSDVRFQAAIVSRQGGVPVVILEPVRATSQDAMCIGVFGGRHGVLLFTFIWGDEAHYQPHRYRVTRYEWTGVRLEKRFVRETVKKVQSWREAAKILGYRCNTNLLTTAVGAE
jgi:hypothetical protein